MRATVDLAIEQGPVDGLWSPTTDGRWVRAHRFDTLAAAEAFARELLLVTSADGKMSWTYRRLHGGHRRVWPVCVDVPDPVSQGVVWPRIIGWACFELSDSRPADDEERLDDRKESVSRGMTDAPLPAHYQQAVAEEMDDAQARAYRADREDLR